LLTRVDVRLALYLAGLTAAFTSALLCGLLAYALKESLEEQIARVDDMITAVDHGLPGGGQVASALHPTAPYRVRSADGHELAAGGSWPPLDAMRREVSVRTALFANADEFVLRERTRSDGGIIQAAAPLKHFVRERGELMDRTIIVVLLGFLGSIVLGVMSARRALRPLHDTTAAIRAIDPRRLADRLPLRGNGDDVDALTLATNEVLARLEGAFTRLAAFSADAAHELRTPVNRILNMAEVALTTTDDPTTKDDALAGVRDTADAMRRSIDQLLLLARGEDGGLPLTRDDVDLGAVLIGLGELYAPAAERLDKQLVVAANAAATVRADRELIERAVANLLENGLGHTERGAKIWIGIERRDGTAVVVVEDSGPGIAATDRERIFDRFVRLDDARNPEGAGLGLPIARMIARLHDGDLTVGASPLGGAAFRLVLPVADG